MTVNVNQTLRAALGKLRGERDRLNRQITAIEVALGVGDEMNRASGMKTRRRKGMSSATRKAISGRMKAYWAKRKKTAGKKAG